MGLTKQFWPKGMADAAEEVAAGQEGGQAAYHYLAGEGLRRMRKAVWGTHWGRSAQMTWKRPKDAAFIKALHVMGWVIVFKHDV